MRERICRLVRELLTDESGATMVEYAIMAGFIAAVCALAVSIIGLKVNGYFTDARDGFN